MISVNIYSSFNSTLSSFSSVPEVNGVFSAALTPSDRVSASINKILLCRSHFEDPRLPALESQFPALERRGHDLLMHERSACDRKRVTVQKQNVSRKWDGQEQGGNNDSSQSCSCKPLQLLQQSNTSKNECPELKLLSFIFQHFQGFFSAINVLWIPKPFLPCPSSAFFL